jgi:hypothetical protein
LGSEPKNPSKKSRIQFKRKLRSNLNRHPKKFRNQFSKFNKWRSKPRSQRSKRKRRPSNQPKYLRIKKKLKRFLNHKLKKRLQRSPSRSSSHRRNKMISFSSHLKEIISLFLARATTIKLFLWIRSCSSKK